MVYDENYLDSAPEGTEFSCSFYKNEKPKIFLLNGEKYTPIYNSHRIGQIKNFIIRNRELLLSHWDGKITTKEFISKMKKV